MRTNPLHMFPAIEVLVFLMAHAFRLLNVNGGQTEGVTGSSYCFAIKTMWDASQGSFVTPELLAQIHSAVCIYLYVSYVCILSLLCI